MRQPVLLFILKGEMDLAQKQQTGAWKLSSTGANSQYGVTGADALIVG